MAIGNPTQVGASPAGGTAAAPWTNASLTTISTATTCVIPANSLVVTVILTANTTIDPAVPTQVTDGTNTVTVADKSAWIGSAGRISIFSWRDTAGRTATITATLGAGGQNVGAMYVFTISGAATSSWLDVSNATSSSAATGMAITTIGNVAQADSVSLAAFARGTNIAAPTTWPGAGYTSLVNTTESVRQKGMNVEYKNALTAGATETAGGTLSAATNISRVIVVYKGAAAGGSALTKSLADTITLSDATVKGVTVLKTDTITLSDAVVKAIGKRPADTITLSDATAKAVGVTKSDTITLSDSISRVWAALQTFADTITLSDTRISGIGVKKADTITLSDNTTTTSAYRLLLNDTITLTMGFTKTFSGGVAAAKAVHRWFNSRFGFY